MEILVSVRIKKEDNRELYETLKKIPAKSGRRSIYIRELLIRGFLLEQFKGRVERLIKGQKEMKSMLKELLDKGVTVIEEKPPADDVGIEDDDKKWEENMLRMYDHFNR